MKKLIRVTAAIAALGSITPALAQDVSVRVGSGYHHRAAVHERVVVRDDRGLHRGWDRGHHYGWRHANHRGHARVVIR